ncbi:TetR/AcrR family transcriptional regulator [Planotetraspora phitsanulokensis]|uniref:TetR family transcriptional regulator n=1 Tax=Planotetraspora phitsanulokensis TaxID=575192 RepID=A0A8J3XC85_9ACTN|nr:helix-turn-helix domain-containing protein [Planotetraspora phitsanulokensis]GII35857.1 TetR family transcriptional regulator [Planotetraspora phitsanulokensis]
MERKPKRRYVSEVRRENAEATRLRIAEAARALMLEHGYASTTMADVARAAGVVVQTLYTSCPGGKPGLAKLVWDVTLAGDAQAVPQSARPQVQAIVDEPDPTRKLVAFAEMALSIYQRVGPVHRVLRAAAATDAGLADLLADTERQRLAGSRGPAEHLAAVGVLRTGLGVERAADQIYALTSIELFERLTEVCGWTMRDCQDWLAQILSETLLEPTDHEGL